MMLKVHSALLPTSARQGVTAAEVASSSIQVAPATSYPRRPPHFANLDLLEPGDRGAMESRWKATQQASPPILLHYIDSATIVPPGVVWLPEGEAVTESLHNMHMKDRATLLAAGPPRPSTRPGKVDRNSVIQGATLLLARAGSMNYGHWLAEHLSALLLLRDVLPDLQPRLLVNDPRGPAMLQVFAESVRLAGFDPGALLPMTRGASLQSGELLMFSPASQHSFMKHPLAIAALAELAPPRPATERLFVRRTSTAKRVLHNLDQVEAAAIRLGFRVIEPGRMTLTDQITAFAGARVVVGVSGADLTNTVFMPKGGDVICLLPARGREFFFWDICCIREHRYWSIFGHPLTQRGGGHDDFEVDVELTTSIMARTLTVS